MKTLVFDATPLIYLAKVSLLEKLADFKEKNVISSAVYAEVVEAGLKKGALDAAIISNLAEDGVFEVLKLKDKEFYKHLSKSPKLHSADAEVLALARELDGCAVIDERFGRHVAEQEKISCRSTVFILFKLLKAGLIDKMEFRKKLDEMISEGWFCYTDFYAKVLDLLENTKL